MSNSKLYTKITDVSIKEATTMEEHILKRRCIYDIATFLEKRTISIDTTPRLSSVFTGKLQPMITAISNIKTSQNDLIVNEIRNLFNTQEVSLPPLPQVQTNTNMFKTPPPPPPNIEPTVYPIVLSRITLDSVLLNSTEISYTDYFKQILTNEVATNDKIQTAIKDMKTFNYSEIVHLLSNPSQIYLWILRTLMLYDFLITVSNKLDDAYDKTKYRLGIFGSNETTSDIDIGFTYIGTLSDTDHTPLSTAIQPLEDLFISQTTLISLDFDIEPYANFMTLSDGSYYLDTREMTFTHLLRLLPYVGAGILRNYIQSFMDLGYNPDIRRQKVDHSVDQSALQKITNELDGFLTMVKQENTQQVNVQPETMKNVNEFTLFYNDLVTQDKREIVFNALFGKDAVGMISSYLLKSYNDSRALYYSYVIKAESFYYGTICRNLHNISIENIIQMLMLSSIADIFRAESYVSPVTVMDIVRGKQGKQYEEIQKDPTLCQNKPIKYAPCLIGPYGYIISILENLGYITRFRLTFCDQHKDPNPSIPLYSAEKCEHKISQKYLPRVTFSFDQLIQNTRIDGFDITQENIKDYVSSIAVSTVQAGGRRTRYKRPRITKRRRAKRTTRRCKKRKHTRAK
jgi:hypothetical protein